MEARKVEGENLSLFPLCSSNSCTQAWRGLHPPELQAIPTATKDLPRPFPPPPRTCPGHSLGLKPSSLCPSHCFIHRHLGPLSFQGASPGLPEIGVPLGGLMVPNLSAPYTSSEPLGVTASFPSRLGALKGLTGPCALSQPAPSTGMSAYPWSK